MRYIEVVKEFLPDALQDVEKNILNDYEALEFIPDKEKLKKLLEYQSRLLMDYFSNFPEEKEINISEIEKFYENLDIPYLIIEKSIDELKNKFLERIAIEKELENKDFLLSVKEYIEKLQNKIAYIYLKKEAKNLGFKEKKTFSKYLLYNAKLKYMENIVNSILKDDLKNFPLQKASQCEFHKYLYYPESLMICNDAALCNHLDEIHKVIHNIANALYIFLLRKDYKQAYLSFLNLKENYLKLSTILAELYFLTSSDAEEHFFNLLEYMEYQPNDKYVYIIDIQNLKKLNAIYSEEKITNAIRQIEKDLTDWVLPKKDKYLLIRGITANFYMLTLEIDENEILKNVDIIKNFVEKEFKLNGQYKKFEVSIGVLKLSNKFLFSKKEILKILLYLKEKAKSSLSNVYMALNDDTIQQALDFINEKYKNIDYVSKKIENKEIEVVFQPIFNSKTRKIEALESLVRIIKEDGSLIPAGIFIDNIIEAGLIYKLDILVLEKLLEKKELIKQVTDRIFINASPESFLTKEYIDKLKEFLNQMKDLNIIMELTEQKLLEDIEIVKSLELEFDNLHFAIDDFGSGYSSLKFVAEMAEKKILKILKIDGSLVKNAREEEIIQKLLKAISSMVKSLNIKAVAEFVENKETLELLSKLDIEYSQGFYLSKPQPIENILLQVLTE